MSSVQDVAKYLETFAPTALAEDWDNVGLLVGRREAAVERVMTCLTITPPTAAEAVAEKVDLIVTHHPLPFHAVKRLTSDTPEGRMLLDLISAGCAIYSPHTAFDSTARGINQLLAEGIGLRDIAPLVVADDASDVGTGRVGQYEPPQTLSAVVTQVKEFLSVESVKHVGPPDREIRRVATACGAAGQMLEDALRAESDLLILGETSFHTCLRAQANDVSLILTGHYASERFAVEHLAEELGREFTDIDVWASREESDPVVWA